MKLQGDDVSNVKTWEDLRRFTAKNFQRILSVVNGSVAFGDNLTGTPPIDFKITAANQIVQVSFNLAYVPSNFLITFKDANSDIWVPSVSSYPWTSGKAFLTASAAVSGKVVIF